MAESDVPGTEDISGVAGTYIVSPGRLQQKSDASHIEVLKEAAGHLKTSKDGRTILIPQPSDDPLDPLNWSWSTKHGVLLAVSFGALLTDWGIAWGTTLFEAQAVYWGMSVSAVANSVSGANFLQGVGGVLAVPITQRYGR